MTEVTKLTALQDKVALYEKNLKLVVENCKILKSEKENLISIIANLTSNPNDLDVVAELKKNYSNLARDFMANEKTLTSTKHTLLKENSELKQKLAEMKNALKGSDNGFQIADLEQKLLKEKSLNKTYEKRIQNLEDMLKQRTENSKNDDDNERQINELKKLYEGAIGRSIILERKLASLELNSPEHREDRSAAKTLKEFADHDATVQNLENQISMLSSQCDELQSDVMEYKTLLTEIKGENDYLRHHIAELEKKKTATKTVHVEEPFSTMMKKKYREYQSNGERNPLDFCTDELRRDIIYWTNGGENSSIENSIRALEEKLTAFESNNQALRTEISREIDARRRVERESQLYQKETDRLNESIAEKNTELIRIHESLIDEKEQRMELEHELFKQRSRAQGEIDVLERESEAYKKMLVNIRNESVGKTVHKTSKDRRSPYGDDSFMKNRSISIDDGIPIDADSRNIYYENQLSKKESDINDLRKQLMDLEVRLRESDSVAMSRQLEAVANAEKLEEHIRSLEAKLSMMTSPNDLDYLRNVFSRYLHTVTSPTSASKSILKAMASVLKVPDSDMKVLDKM